MHKIIEDLSTKFPNIEFKIGDKFYWSPKDSIVYYLDELDNEESIFALFHELGHAKLKHKFYNRDFDLIRMEVSAWDEAKKLARKYHKKIDENHIQDCLDTYRDWIYKRSKCPKCGVVSIQTVGTNRYSCFNCSSEWSVSSSKFCRPYRTLISN